MWGVRQMVGWRYVYICDDWIDGWIPAYKVDEDNEQEESNNER